MTEKILTYKTVRDEIKYYPVGNEWWPPRTNEFGA